MENLNIAGSDSSPAIQGNWQSGILAMQGDSYPENSFALFQPVLAWVDNFLKNTDRHLTLDLRLVYLNTSSVKVLMDLFDMLENAHHDGRVVAVNWGFDDRNERIAELAEEFKEDCSFPFAIVAER
jgi:hypothetical protein